MTEQELRELIELKYGSVRQMALKIDMPASTINSILNRGILKSAQRLGFALKHWQTAWIFIKQRLKRLKS